MVGQIVCYCIVCYVMMSLWRATSDWPTGNRARRLFLLAPITAPVIYTLAAFYLACLVIVMCVAIIYCAVCAVITNERM